MADDVKRLNYFDKQFLHEQDFNDEQAYHVQHQRDTKHFAHILPGQPQQFRASHLVGEDRPEKIRWPAFAGIAQNEIGEKCFASPAISHSQLFLRGDHHLFCIGEKQ